MTELSQKQLAHLEKLLRDRDTDLRADIRREKAATDDYQQIASEAPDTGDASTATLYVDLGNAAVSRDVQELRDIEATLQRMSDGTYGTCIECGRPIPYERLLAQPTATRDTAHQDQYEKTHAAPSRPTSL